MTLSPVTEERLLGELNEILTCQVASTGRWNDFQKVIKKEIEKKKSALVLPTL